jgi:hypothetical protein
VAGHVRASFFLYFGVLQLNPTKVSPDLAVAILHPRPPDLVMAVLHRQHRDLTVSGLRIWQAAGPWICSRLKLIGGIVKDAFGKIFQVHA